MLPLTSFVADTWRAAAEPRHYAYAAVLGAVAIGWLAPGTVAWLLGPALLGGMVLLGVAHGACDQFVVPATHPALARGKGRYWAGFLAGYLGLAAAVAGLWWWQPTAAVALFFGLTAWHWGSADAPAQTLHRSQWLAHSLLRGGLLFAVPLWHWPTKTQGIVSGLLALTGGAPMRAATVTQAASLLLPIVAGGLILLWLSYLWQQQAALARTDALETLLLMALLLVLPPVLSAGVYFVFWHSLRHVLRMNQLMDRRATAPRGLGHELRFFLRRSAPLLLISVGGLAVLFGLAWARAASGPVLVSLALLAASVVTLPHALLVTLGMDAARWRRKSEQ
ncbi:Brp/Blh family beta-carotene 15,15'-dioxygenase [Hymenobacter terricola]|uniref:Brp/Blh family beta-carotene 15,15'-dioxygenase n=1 Tax=Hymenobacter terricola TaxID=2819236 RepID=UPI001B307988|nr:Brp/Blh family beta-carotene 15,15'-dioxygenase [Hymenobacter terricola]